MAAVTAGVEDDDCSDVELGGQVVQIPFPGSRVPLSSSFSFDERSGMATTTDIRDDDDGNDNDRVGGDDAAYGRHGGRTEWPERKKIRTLMSILRSAN
uniref:Uncharacterized protein n=1 Tax=Leersia perrieri TaxID=77586 RepID=A0A0D9VDF8_9ORYZ